MEVESQEAEDLPDWADPALSRALPQLCAKGENQDLEYMREFPENLRELAKEVAAFASSHSGVILTGVTDDGEVCGIPDVHNLGKRDYLLKQVQNVCNGAVNPAITPMARFAVRGDKGVLVLTVPKGRQPIYYSHKIPYLRHITESRYAQPHEVVERVREWLAESSSVRQEDEVTTARSQLISDLAYLLVEVLIYGDEADYREVNPWLDMWLAQYTQFARELRDMAVTDAGVELELTDRLRHLADSLEEVAKFRFYLGCGAEFNKLLDRVLSEARGVKAEFIDSKSLSKESLDGVPAIITRCARQLADLSRRAETMAYDGRLEELNVEAAGIGHTLLRLAYYNVDVIVHGLSNRLKQVGLGLHLLETAELLIDGGDSIVETVNRIRESDEELGALKVELESSDLGR